MKPNEIMQTSKEMLNEIQRLSNDNINLKSDYNNLLSEHELTLIEKSHYVGQVFNLQKQVEILNEIITTERKEKDELIIKCAELKEVIIKKTIK